MCLYRLFVKWRGYGGIKSVVLQGPFWTHGEMSAGGLRAILQAQAQQRCQACPQASVCVTGSSLHTETQSGALTATGSLSPPPGLHSRLSGTVTQGQARVTNKPF